ncbi:MAG: lytic transglycosylase domain-containing protein [Bacteroidales bacterium]
MSFKNGYLAIAAFSLLGIFVFLCVGLVNQTEEECIYQEAFTKSYKIFSPPIPQLLYFAGEKVPLDIFHVKERLDRELLVNVYWQSNQLLWMKRANRWFPVIEPILKKNGIPNDFKYLALIESGFINRASSARADGFWQFLPGTARDFGLEVNEEVDERLDVVLSTEAACKYLNSMYNRYKNWAIVAASYNIGRGNMDYHIRTQKQQDYYLLHLPEETLRYVFRILAEKIIFENPESYGFYLNKGALYPPLPVKEVSIDTTVESLFLLSEQLGVSYGILKMYNPWLIERSLPNKSRKNYTLYLPADSSSI